MVLRAAILVFLVVGANALRPANELRPLKSGKAASTNLQLDDKVNPSTYNIELTTHIDKFDASNANSFTYEGIVQIEIETAEKGLKQIVLHKHDDIEITKAQLNIENGQLIELKHDQFDSLTQTLTLEVTSSDSIPAKSTLYIEFTGKHSNEMNGFYRSSYIDDKNNTRWLITTQFEAYGARRAFPCFDEPRFKAKFTITIKVPKISVDGGYNALSNMPLESGSPTDDGDNKVYKFQQTSKKMSSYLVAFVISDFIGSEEATFDLETKTFKTWGRAKYVNANQTELSQIAGPAGLDVLKDYTSTPFGLPKLDQVGIPDFSAGAMENWGLCTYRERVLFSDVKTTSLTTKQNIVTTTIHELAHQWFGDLVTLYWWSDIWLNEGFATFFEYHATDRIRTDKLNTSEWNIIGQMLTDEIQAGALTLDAEVNTRPLHSEVNTLAEIDANFDSIAYSKGGSVIRMWMHILGEESFRNGLKVYMDNNGESVGRPDALFTAFKEKADQDLGGHIDQFIDWVNQAGFPVINASRDGSTVTLSQERFLVSADTDESKWEVPVTYTTSKSPNFDETKPKVWLAKDVDAVNITIVENVDWYLVNLQQTGYYRVNYDVSNWEKLGNALRMNHRVIHEYNRAQIIDDANWLARATNRSYTPYHIALNTTKYLKNERELVPWKAGLNSLNYLYSKLANNEAANKLETFILDLISPTYAELGLENKETESYTTQLLRPLIASWACRLGHKKCLEDCKSIFEGSEALTGEGISADIKSTVICSAIRQGGEETWNRVKAAYDSTNDNADQTLFLSTLGCSKDKDILARYLNMTLSDEGGIRKQDRTAVFAAVYSGNPENVAVAFQWLQENLDTIAAQYGGGLDPVGGLLTGIATRLGSDDDLKKIKELKDRIENSDNPQVSGGVTGARIAVDVVTSNNAWITAKLPDVSQWLKENYAQVPGGNSAAYPTVTLAFIILPALASLFLW